VIDLLVPECITILVVSDLSVSPWVYHHTYTLNTITLTRTLFDVYHYHSVDPNADDRPIRP